MTSNRHARSIAALLAACFAGSIPACTSDQDPNDKEVGSAQAAVTNVPNDGTVACISITATGSWVDTQSFDVAPGQSTVFSLTGIPVGTVRFDGVAFPTACGLVTPMSIPTWASAPVFAPVTSGQTTIVTLDLHEAGSVGVGVNFNPPPACRANGLPCLANAECCSSACGVTGTCQAPTGCTLPSDCPGSTTECRIVTCTSGACGVALVPAGTVTSAQTPGDCQSMVCDGAGATVAAPDASDTPSDDGNACTTELCQGGVPVVVALATGAACAQNGGQVCSNGTCVQCISQADCPMGYTCMGGTCAPPQCNDTLKNGAETDVDCGGPNCAPCGLGHSCVADADCMVGAYCGFGVCSPQKSVGQPAGTNNECMSGFAVDGVCCNTACSSTCVACSAAKKGSGVDGVCGSIQSGFDPDNECPSQAAASCGTTGSCNGAGACALYPAGTSCGGGSLVCDGAGTCLTAPSVVSTTPADGSFTVAGATVAITFSQAMNPATLQAQASAGACTGSIQVSVDGFASCIAFPAAPVISGGGTVATLTAAPGLLVNRTYGVRVTTAAQNASGTALASAFTSPLGFNTTSAHGCSGALVISQVYGAGGFAGASYRNDFVELHNRDSVPVSLSGLSLQYVAAAGTAWTAIPLNGTIPPGGYYLVQFASGGANGALLPTPDMTSVVNLGSGSGKVALVNGTSIPAGTCPPAGATIDLVGYGTANCAEGAATPVLTATTAAVRGSAGCADNGTNSLDFTTSLPTPRNSASVTNVCACSQATVQNESGSVGEVDYCAVQFPLSIVIGAGLTSTVYARVFEAGVTGQGSPSPNVRAQLGVGPFASNPQYEAGFTWVDGTYNPACVGCGTNDEYQATFTASTAGTFAYVYRVSVDQGQTWTYCDLAQADSGAGSNPGLSFDFQNEGVLTVTP